MSFRHYTKLKEIADRVGCDSSDCTTNGALLDRIYESPITPVEPTDVYLNNILNNVRLKAVKPVEGHLYASSVNLFDVDPNGYMLVLDGVMIKGIYNSQGESYTVPISDPFNFINNLTCMFIYDDVENPAEGELLMVKYDASDAENPIGLFSVEEIESINSTLLSYAGGFEGRIDVQSVLYFKEIITE